MMDERELERIAARLGDHAAARLDVDRVAAGVIARLRAAPPVAQPRPAMRWLAVAASLTVLISATVFTVRNLGVTPVEAPPGAIVPGLTDLSTPELDEVLDSLSWQAPASAQLATTLDDLDASQLKQLLALMEG